MSVENYIVRDILAIEVVPHCSASDAVMGLLDLLVQANMHEERDAKDDDIYADISEAQTMLFQLATAHAERRQREHYRSLRRPHAD